MPDNLVLKSINRLLGEDFFIPYYQRGYRWTEQQVLDLLDDIWAFRNKSRSTTDAEFYCLQPIVVKKKTWHEKGKRLSGWEVIDGQQRLTTLYIILYYLTKEYLHAESLRGNYGKDSFTLRYETRKNSEHFLKDIHDDASNIDFYYMSKAYRIVKDWFSNGKNMKDRTDRENFLSTILGKEDDRFSVQIIWYEAEPQADGKELFTRLNMGKIPLTNSELIKALFLSSSGFDDEAFDETEKQKLKNEIALLWDEMELRMADQDFWAFISNVSQSNYANKIELLFDMMANKKKREFDPLYTFIQLYQRVKTKDQSLRKLWFSIEQYYQTLCEWYKNKNLYHKVGYLINIGENLDELIAASLQTRKDKFENKLDGLISEKVNFQLADLSYEENADHEKISRVLLLFNVESIRSNASIAEKYPFRFHKSTRWSLEHIHAQNSEGLDRNKKEQWINWLNYHVSLMEEIRKNQNKDRRQKFEELIKEARALDRYRLSWEKFNALSERIIEQFSKVSGDSADDMHSISNLALLSQPDNNVLNNSVFEVKRREIIKLDKEGKYIPICTRRVFLKYYNPMSSAEQFYFWSHDDRVNYLHEMKTVLQAYLPQQESAEE
ncbi:MAG TPA: DUF262 domain-containing protein [Bacillota bacterium]|nr:DUF262 domain-containing protein [Bacillota bacterium]